MYYQIPIHHNVILTGRRGLSQYVSLSLSPDRFSPVKLSTCGLLINIDSFSHNSVCSTSVMALRQWHLCWSYFSFSLDKHIISVAFVREDWSPSGPDAVHFIAEKLATFSQSLLFFPSWHSFEGYCEMNCGMVRLPWP